MKDHHFQKIDWKRVFIFWTKKLRCVILSDFLHFWKEYPSNRRCDQDISFKLWTVGVINHKLHEWYIDQVPGVVALTSWKLLILNNLKILLSPTWISNNTNTRRQLTAIDLFYDHYSQVPYLYQGYSPISSHVRDIGFQTLGNVSVEWTIYQTVRRAENRT